MSHTLSTIGILALLSTAPFVHAQQVVVQSPANLTSETYSSSAVEVFWSRTTGAVEYSVSRGNSVFELIDGTSFFEEGLEPRTTYQYQIRSIDADGNESEASIIAVTTRGGIPETDTTRPLDLRVDVYSNTALELFWRREFGGPFTYEVSRDGVVIATTTGSSFFDDGLTPGTNYDYQVSKLGSAAPPAIATPVTNGARLDVSGQAADDVLLENARLVVYSNTAAELLWDRPTPDAFVDRVEVLRGTGSVATESLGRFDATSFFDDTREPGVAYSYALIARDQSGNILERLDFSDDAAADPVSIDFVSPILGEFNQREIVNLAFSVFSGQAFGNDVLRLPYHSNPTYSSVELIGGAPADARFTDTVCDNGGIAQFLPLDSEDGSGSGWDFFFDNCLDGTEIIDGELLRLSANTINVSSPFGITIDGSEREARYSGSMLRTFDAPPNGRNERDMTANDLNVTYTQDGETFELVDANFRYETTFPVSARMEGSFHVRSPLTQNRLLEVLIIDPFEWRRDVNNPVSVADWVPFDTGSMIITAEDGTEFQVDALSTSSFLRINVLPSERVGNTFFQWGSFSESLPLFIPSF